MNENVKGEIKSRATPVLIPVELDNFWHQVRLIIREELQALNIQPVTEQSPGFVQQPLLKIEEVKKMFRVSHQTIHDWCNHGKLRKIKIRSRVYFLTEEIQELIGQNK